MDDVMKKGGAEAEDVTRRRALKLAATGVAAPGVAAVGGQDALAAQKQTPHPGPNGGVPVELVDPEGSEAAPAILTGTFGFAVVNSAGTLVRGRGTVSSANLGTGIYQVIFDSNIRQAAYLGTIGLPGASGNSPAGQISVVGRFTDVRGVFVQTFNSSGNPQNLAFHLAVFA